MLHEVTAIILVLAVGFALSQLPRFVQEYEQRLGGTLQEASRELEAFRTNAETAGLPFNEYVRRHLDSPDPAIQATGRTIRDLVVRVAELRGRAEALAAASKFTKPVVLAQTYDPGLARATWKQFVITATFDPAFGAIGIVLGWLLNALLWVLLGRRRVYG